MIDSSMGGNTLHGAKDRKVVAVYPETRNNILMAVHCIALGMSDTCMNRAFMMLIHMAMATL